MVTHEEALRLADALVGQALQETEARCRVLAEFIGDCERAGAHNSAWNEAVRELSTLHDRRRGLLRRQSLIQQALECPVGESPAEGSLPPPPNRAVPQRQQQVQVQVRAQPRSFRNAR